jgi:hypothetical protein
LQVSSEAANLCILLQASGGGAIQRHWRGWQSAQSQQILMTRSLQTSRRLMLFPFVLPLHMLQTDNMRHHCSADIRVDMRMQADNDDDEEYGAAEQKSQQFFASVMGNKQHQQPAQHVAKSDRGQPSARPKPVHRPPPPPVTQTKSFKPFGGSDSVLRGKVGITSNAIWSRPFPRLYTTCSMQHWCEFQTAAVRTAAGSPGFPAGAGWHPPLWAVLHAAGAGAAAGSAEDGR